MTRTRAPWTMSRGSPSKWSCHRATRTSRVLWRGSLSRQPATVTPYPRAGRQLDRLKQLLAQLEHDDGALEGKLAMEREVHGRPSAVQRSGSPPPPPSPRWPRSTRSISATAMWARSRSRRRSRLKGARVPVHCARHLTCSLQLRGHERPGFDANGEWHITPYDAHCIAEGAGVLGTGARPPGTFLPRRVLTDARAGGGGDPYYGKIRLLQLLQKGHTVTVLQVRLPTTL